MFNYKLEGMWINIKIIKLLMDEMQVGSIDIVSDGRYDKAY